MSRTKAVVIDGRLRWVWSDTHDVVLALMVEAAEKLDGVAPERLAEWRVWACIPDLALSTAATTSVADRETLCSVLHVTRALALERGDVTREHVRRWLLGEGLVVCDGELYTAKVSVEQTLEVIDGYLAALGGDRREAVLLGAPQIGPSPGTTEGARIVVRVEPEISYLDARGDPVFGGASPETARRVDAARQAPPCFQAARVTAGEKLFVIFAAGPNVLPLSRDRLASIRHREQASVVLVEEDRPGMAKAQLLGTAAREAAAAALAVLKVSWGWDDSGDRSEAIVTGVDAECFRVKADFDERAKEWTAVAWRVR